MRELDTKFKFGRVRISAPCQDVQVRNVQASSNNYCVLPTASCTIHVPFQIGEGNTNLWKGSGFETGSLLKGDVLETVVNFARPVTITADVKSAGRCASMMLFAPDKKTTSGYSIGLDQHHLLISYSDGAREVEDETIGQYDRVQTLNMTGEKGEVMKVLDGNLLVLWDGETDWSTASASNVRIIGKVHKAHKMDHWQTLGIEVDAFGKVRFYLNWDLVKTIEDESFHVGNLKFTSDCDVGMQVRNVAATLKLTQCHTMGRADMSDRGLWEANFEAKKR